MNFIHVQSISWLSTCIISLLWYFCFDAKKKESKLPFCFFGKIYNKTIDDECNLLDNAVIYWRKRFDYFKRRIRHVEVFQLFLDFPVILRFWNDLSVSFIKMIPIFLKGSPFQNDIIFEWNHYLARILRRLAAFLNIGNVFANEFCRGLWPSTVWKFKSFYLIYGSYLK